MELTGSLSGRQTLSGGLANSQELTGGISTAPGQGTKDYNKLKNKPSINGITVENDKIDADYHLQHKLDFASQHDIEKILYLD